MSPNTVLPILSEIFYYSESQWWKVSKAHLGCAVTLLSYVPRFHCGNLTRFLLHIMGGLLFAPHRAKRTTPPVNVMFDSTIMHGGYWLDGVKYFRPMSIETLQTLELGFRLERKHNMELQFAADDRKYGEGRGNKAGVEIEFPSLEALLTPENVRQIILSGGRYLPVFPGEPKDDTTVGWVSSNGTKSYATAKKRLAETVMDILASVVEDDDEGHLEGVDVENLAVSVTDAYRKGLTGPNGNKVYPEGTIGWTIRVTN